MTDNNLIVKPINDLTLADNVVDTQSIINTIDGLNTRLDGINLRTAADFEDIIQILQEITERFGNTVTFDGYIVMNLDKDDVLYYI